jgi:uncharacterized protein YecT (DUF1311 family)
MTNTKVPIFAAVIFVLLTSSFAAVAEPSPSAKVCNSDTLQTNDYVACLEKALEASEHDAVALVAKAFDEIAKGDLDAPEKEKTKKLLETAQSEWKRYRDAECAAFARHTAGLGFGATQFRLACLIDETVQRVEILKTRYELN